MNRTVVEEV